MPHSHPPWPVSHPGIHGFDTWWMTERAVPTSLLNCDCYNETGSACPLPKTEQKNRFAEVLILGEDFYLIFERFTECIIIVNETENFTIINAL